MREPASACRGQSRVRTHVCNCAFDELQIHAHVQKALVHAAFVQSGGACCGHAVALALAERHKLAAGSCYNTCPHPLHISKFLLIRNLDVTAVCVLDVMHRRWQC